MKDLKTYDVLFTFTEKGRSGMTYIATVEATDKYNAVYQATFELLNQYEETDFDGLTYLPLDDVRVDSVTLIEEPK